MAAATQSSECFRATPEFRQNLVTGDCDQPGRDSSLCLETMGVSPDLKENLIDDSQAMAFCAPKREKAGLAGAAICSTIADCAPPCRVTRSAPQQHCTNESRQHEGTYDSKPSLYGAVSNVPNSKASRIIRFHPVTTCASENR